MQYSTRYGMINNIKWYDKRRNGTKKEISMGNMKSIEELNERRKEMGLSYPALSKLCGVPAPTLQKVLSGTTGSPRYHTLKKIEEALFGSGQETGLLRERAAVYQTGQDRGEETISESSLPDQVRSIACKPQGTLTIADYELIPDDERYELIDGVLIRLEAPTTEHQRLSMFLSAQLYLLAERESCGCTVLTAPCDVQLDEDDRTIVQPDIFVYCDEERINTKRCVGAPDLCIEILSPSTRSKDMLLKRYKYERAHVREFWVVDPEFRRIVTYVFDREPVERSYHFGDRIPIGICGENASIDFGKYRG